MWIDGVLPDWLEKGVESTLRDSEDDAPPAPLAPTAISSAGQMRSKGLPSPPVVLTPTVSRPSSRNGTKGPWQDLDSFYAEEEEEEDDNDNDSEDGSSDEDDESGDDDEGSEEEEEDDVTLKTS